MVIKQLFLKHKGGLYTYRVHNKKLDSYCKENGFNPLYNYLQGIFNECPNEYFNTGPRSSTLKFKLVDDLIEVQGHEVSLLARYGLDNNQFRFNDNHSKVQVFMLENDKNTIAMEVPIWLYPNEIGCYESVFRSKEVLTGHIDLLRIDDDKIWIWDYKPNANKEKYAPTQIFFYALMLSKRTGLDLSKFRCGYFDSNYAFLFKPQDKFLERLSKQKRLF
ncbi:PD-(D/E)XK nuclease family protein [Candidatus Woesearchaeota archaeon]|nr:PD-(D/E)XK nuclease family protein [Candidatus Woesearchaeota archaeon]